MVNMASLLLKDYVGRTLILVCKIMSMESLVLCRKLIARLAQVEWNGSIFKQDFQRRLYLPVP